MASGNIQKAFTDKIYASGRYLRCACTNYGSSITIDGISAVNTGGLIITGQGSNTGVFAFTSRLSSDLISVEKIGGTQNVTFTTSYTVDSSHGIGSITFTPSVNTHMMVLYMTNN